MVGAMSELWGVELVGRDHGLDQKTRERQPFDFTAGWNNSKVVGDQNSIRHSRPDTDRHWGVGSGFGGRHCAGFSGTDCR